MTKLPSAGKLNVFVYADFGALPDFLVLAAWLFPVPLKKKKERKKTHTQVSQKVLVFSACSITLILDPFRLSTNIVTLFLLNHEI